MAVLIIGGGGFIGSHMVKRLLCYDEEVVILDNFSTGYRDAVIGGICVRGDFGDRETLREIFRRFSLDTIMVFASFIDVAESVRDPAKYYANNVASFCVLLQEMVSAGIRNLIFSSSAAVYGQSVGGRLDENTVCNPITPYGRSKRMIEQMLEDCSQAYDMSFISFRYFNAAGADPDGRLGERHDPETHLVPLVLQAASGRRNSITVFGTDYPTRDGTCIRDYVHVEDICSAHQLGLDRLREGAASDFYNLGNSVGYSNLEVIETARSVTGRSIPLRYGPRRQGDPVELIASSHKIRADLGWSPKYSDLGTIIENAWKWEMKKGAAW